MTYKIKAKKFDISTKQGLELAERYKQRLEKEYPKVRLDIIGYDKIMVYGKK